jgi:1-acyl-sn-glycerol-3-phosphate acyltransferase
MPKGRSWPKPGRPPVGVVFGEPIMSVEDEAVVDFMERARDAVTTLYAENYEEIMGVPRPEEESE